MLQRHKHGGVRRLTHGRRLAQFRHHNTNLGSSLVVEREDVVSSACLTLPNEKHSVSLGPGALDQVGCLHPGDGPVEPGVGEQEVIALLDDLLRHGKGDGVWRVGRRNTIQLMLLRH